MEHWVYILHSVKLNRFYTGETSDFDIRKTFHDKAEAHKFTAKANDWELFIKIECRTKEQGLKVEAHIKRMKSSTYIKNLKRYPEIIERLLVRYQDHLEPR